MNIRARTSIAVLITLSSSLLATQYASAQSPSGEESILLEAPEERCDFCGLKTLEYSVEQATLRELAIQADYSRSDYQAHCLTPRRLHVQILDPLLVATLELDRERRVAGESWSPWCVEWQRSYPLTFLMSQPLNRR